MVRASSPKIGERTVRADISFLKDRFQAPIKVSREKGYHYTDREWRLPTIPLTKGELFALTLGGRMLEAYAGSAYAPQLRSAIGRLAQRLPEQEWLDLQQLADERLIFRAGAETHLDWEIWQRLEDACREKRRVWMRYRTASRGDQVSERELDPYLLHIYRGTNPYVIGWCHKRQEVRWFVVPTPVGVNQALRQGSPIPRRVVPTPVGVNLPYAELPRRIKGRCPHTRGGEPLLIRPVIDTGITLSPHPWG